jgi:phthalate 4,5-dioxygenase oxygenase subunit
MDDAATRALHHVVPGVDLDRTWFKLATVDNWFNQDRAAMKNGDWTGIAGFTNQDMACQETMGNVVDRTQEHLGTSDIAIIRMRRRMLDAVGHFQRGEPLIGHDPAIDWSRVKSEQLIMPIDEPWQRLGASPAPASR